MERTLIIFKPEAVERKVCWKLLKRWEQKGYTIIATELKIGKRKDFENHYIEHKDKTFYNNLINRMIRGPSMFLVIEGQDVISWSRKIVGNTDPHMADVGTIRGDYGITKEYNLVHAYDSISNSYLEINIWFPNSNFLDISPAKRLI